MIIAINAISAKSGGIKTYTANLLKSLDVYKEYTFHVWLPYNSNFSNGDNVIVHKTRITKYNYLFRLLYEQIILVMKIRKIKANIIFSTGNFGLFFVPIKQIIFIRNSLFFDMNYMKYINPHNSLKKQLKIILKRFNIYISALVSDIIIVPSNYTKRAFADFYPELAKKCLILYEGTKINDFVPSIRVVNNKDDINLLYVSKYYAHKNSGVIVDATKILLNQNIRIRARITMNLDNPLAKSMATWKKDYTQLYDKAMQANILLGEVPYDDVRKLYREADLFIFPSISESYGHPMIEAMAAGLPIIAADTEINHEICGDAAIYFSPFDGNELAEKIITLYNDEDQKRNMIEKGKKRIDLFAWEDHVSKLIKVFKELNGR